MSKLKFKIATPERVVYESEVDSVTCPTQSGEVTILPDHIPLVSNLAPGALSIVEGREEKTMAVTGGFLEVSPKNQVTILADAAEHIEEIDLKRAEEARQRAQDIMREKTLGEEEYAETLGALERSLARIRLARRKKYKDVGRTT